ncbi:MAG TPA: hypothetical protein DEH78_08120 [Solibacterales bacterium]|nr:hypothetical protein [Bryobacterales bacterium]
MEDFNLVGVSLGRGGSAPSQFRQTMTIAATFSDVGPASIQVASYLPDPTPALLAVRLTVTGPLSLTLEQAIQRLQALNVTQDHLVSATVVSPVSVSTTTGAQTVGAPNRTSWVFQLLVPEADLTATLARADQASQASGESTVVYTIAGVGSDAQAIRNAAPAAWSAILQDCKAGAEELASAAGVGVGELRAINEVSSALTLASLSQSRSLGYALAVSFEMNR